MNKNQSIVTNRVGGGPRRNITKNQGGHTLYNDKDTLTLIKASLEEDIGPGDITTEATLKKDKTIEAHITSNQDGILCGIDIAKKYSKPSTKTQHSKNRQMTQKK